MPFENASIKLCTTTLAVNQMFCSVMSVEASGISRLELRSSIIAHFVLRNDLCFPFNISSRFVRLFSPIQQSGILDVTVPPDILNSPEISVDESVTNEGGNVQLMCQATGVPEPRQVFSAIT